MNHASLESELDGYAQLAGQIAGARVALINLIGSQTQWSVSRYGTETREMPRQDSICQYTVAGDGPIELMNLKKDGRFCDKPYVADGPELNFYYGIPLEASSGANIGALCVLHPSNLDLSSDVKEMLKVLAEKAVRVIELSAKNRFLSEEVEVLEMARRRLAHDVRGPLSGIIGIAEVIQLEVGENNFSNVKENNELIHESASSLLEMADAIMSRKSKHEIAQNSLNCALLGDEIRQLFTPQAKVKQLNFEVFAEDPEPVIYFESRYLKQIIGNLVSNAIKFTPERGRVTVRIGFIEAGDARPQTLKISVEDTGVGFPPDKLKMIEAGSVDSGEGTSGESGYGFGLPLVMNLLGRIDGEISIDSEKQAGTCCTVRVPI